jgi:hypothetical protein
MSADMQALQREMIKAGLVEEMMNESLEQGPYVNFNPVTLLVSFPLPFIS